MIASILDAACILLILLQSIKHQLASSSHGHLFLLSFSGFWWWIISS